MFMMCRSKGLEKYTPQGFLPMSLAFPCNHMEDSDVTLLSKLYLHTTPQSSHVSTHTYTQRNAAAKDGTVTYASINTSRVKHLVHVKVIHNINTALHLPSMVRRDNTG